MNFPAAVRSSLYKYAFFLGRAPRSEYWFFTLFCSLVALVAYLLFSNVICMLIELALLLPSLAVSVRRLHDSGRTGWWLLINLVPAVGWLLWIILACLPGQRHFNRFGPDPLEEF